MWQNWVNGILGLWILISPFVGLEGSNMTTNLVIVGIVVAVLGFWSAAAGKKSSMPM
ncbi:SPW repeat protein [Candidatus Wolfebacteria bacterium]|nr:SPW repeat protein [Candidatus Wolfebacteria bacterium]